MAAVSTVSVRPSTLLGQDAAASVCPSTLLGPDGAAAVRTSTLQLGPDDAAALADGSTPARSGYPDWVLLSKKARISDDRNATTASCRTLDGQRVAVTFWLADPPDVSRLSVHLPSIPDSSDPPPSVIAAEGAFVLLCVTLDGADHYFVYCARRTGSVGKKRNKPSLRLLQAPKPAVEAFESGQFGLLPLGGGDHFAVAFLDHRWKHRANAWAYHAYVFSSKTSKWKRSAEALLRLSADSDQPLLDKHASSKAVAVAETSVGWVDLLRGILLLTNLFGGDRPVITYIPLPAEKACITDRRGYPHYAPEYFRDVVCCHGGLIRFVEVDFEDPSCLTNGQAWKATVWHRKVSWDDWRRHRTVHVSDISVDPTCSHSALLPGLVDDKRQELELKNLYFLSPTLSVRDDDLLYIRAKVDEGDDTALVLAVEMKDAALQALVPIATQKSGGPTLYYACAFPKYYMDNTTSEMENQVEKDNSDEVQQGKPNSNDSGENLQKKRRKRKKQARPVDHRVKQPFLLYFVGCVLVAIIVKVFCHLF